MILQLNPQIPVYVPSKNQTGWAIGWIDYSQDHNVMWGVAFDDSGEVWWCDNSDIRLVWNWSTGREKPVRPDGAV